MTNTTELLKEAYFMGWKNCAGWAQRDDLISDEGSGAYQEERDALLATLSQTHEFQSCVSTPTDWIPCTASEARGIAFIGYPVREIEPKENES